MRITMPATRNASVGAIRAGRITFSTNPSLMMALVPSATTAAPTTPPISACDEDEGRPNHQVARFQAIAPIRPPNTIVGVMTSDWTMPCATVAATASEMKAPAKFRSADIPTAIRGDIARVEMLVATAFAVSWKPLVKSNPSAVMTTMTRTTSLSTSSPLGVLDDDALEQVRHVLAGVDRVLEAVEDVLPADDHHGVDPAFEQRGDRLAAHPVAVVLEPVDLHGVVRDVAEAAHPRHRLDDLRGDLHEDVGEALGLLHRRLDPVEAEVVGDLLGVVDDVVQRGRQREDVLAVDRRHERLVQALDDVVRDPVALLLADQDVPGELGVVGPPGEHLVEQVRGPGDVAGLLLEEVEELSVAGGEDLGQESHRAAPYRVKTM